MNDFELCISPVETYEALQIPRFVDHNPALLKKLPSRWQKNAKVIAGLGLVGIFALSGCGGNGNVNWRQSNIEHNLGYVLGGYNGYNGQNNDEYDLGFEPGDYSGYSESELLVRIHTGGSGGSGYVVHLTEQEAFGIIRARLEGAGLVFGSKPPEYTVEMQEREYGLDLYDAYKGVAIVFVGWVGTNRSFRMDESAIANRVNEAFEETTNNIVVGAFYDGGRGLGPGPSWGGTTPSQAEAEAERSALERQLINQADIFIARLQSEGVLEPFSDIGVTIDGAVFNYGALPIIVNNHIMVPAIELFEVLGMERRNDQLPQFILNASNDDIMINIGTSWSNPARNNMRINGEWVSSDIPVFTLNGKVLVPLRHVAEAIGANVEWDEDIQTFRIST